MTDPDTRPNGKTIRAWAKPCVHGLSSTRRLILADVVRGKQPSAEQGFHRSSKNKIHCSAAPHPHLKQLRALLETESPPTTPDLEYKNPIKATTLDSAIVVDSCRHLGIPADH